MKNNTKQEQRIVLQCGRGRCCPEIIKKENNFIIKDDYNGEVKLNQEQIKLLQKAISDLTD
ncbi:MAG: hypothetical protein EBY39_02950 [Flavobacteriia bacterium]|jgi:hypothetical protein|nr:hypothetical protein [Flavobacteriia bacterium]